MSTEEPEATADIPDDNATQSAPAEGKSSSRLSNVIIALTTILAIVSVFSVWARTQLLDTDEWVNLSTELVEQPEVQEAVATYLVEQVYADGNVSEGLEEVLPEDLSGLAGPLAGVIRGPLTDSVAVLLSSDQFQQLWEATNRAAHETLVSVLRGEDVAALATTEGEVALELRELVVVAGETIGLPQDRLDEIPADAARIVIFESDELDSVQQVVQVFEWLAWFLFVLVVALYAIAVFLAPGRRLTALRNVGLSLVAVGVIILAARAIAVRTIVDAIVEDPSGRPTADAVLTVGTSLLRQQGWSAVIYGLLFVGFATLLGNRRWATATRHIVAPAFNASTGAVAGGTAVALLLLLWWSPGRAFNGWTTGLVLIALVIGAVAAMRAQTLREFPDASIDEVEDDLATST